MSEDLHPILENLKSEIHGFKKNEQEALKFIRNHSVETSQKTAIELFNSELYQIRMFAVFILGFISHECDEAFQFLMKRVSSDENWRVQEILAKSFNEYCSKIGYQNSLSIIEEWIQAPNHYLRRAASEGLRIWTNKEYFKENPDAAIKLLSQLKNDESEYVRKSAGNALRDISKKYSVEINREIQDWDLSNRKILQVYKLVTKYSGGKT